MHTSHEPVHKLTHIRELDGLRGVAALVVFFHHVCYSTLRDVPNTTFTKTLYALSMQGSSGVDLFFVLSGFLITSILITARRGPRYYQDFYWKRALRIFPLYIVCLAFVAIAYPEFRKYVLLSSLFIANLAAPLHVASLGPFWTLAIEEQFYIVWPTVVRRRSVPQLKVAAISVIITCILLRFIAAYFGHNNYFLTPLRCDGLAVGAYLACWWLTRSPSQKGATPRENRLMAVTASIGLLLLIPAFTHFNQEYRTFCAAFFQTGVTLVAGSLVAHLIVYSGAPWLGWARSRFLTFFGLISYAFYMIHLYVLTGWDNHHEALTLNQNGPYILRLSSVFLVTVALSILSRYALELPAQKLRRYVLPK